MTSVKRGLCWGQAWVGTAAGTGVRLEVGEAEVRTRTDQRWDRLVRVGLGQRGSEGEGGGRGAE